MPHLLKAALLGTLVLAPIGAGANAADLDYRYAPPPPPPVAYEQPIVVERPVAVYPQPYLYHRPYLYPGPYAYARRVPPPFYGPYRHFAYGPRPYGWYR